MLTLYSLLLSPQLAANYSLQPILRKLPTPYSPPPPNSCYYNLLQFSRNRRPVLCLRNELLYVFYNGYSGKRTPLSAGSSHFNVKYANRLKHERSITTHKKKVLMHRRCKMPPFLKFPSTQKLSVHVRSLAQSALFHTHTHY
jgi:hypothetical protein